MASVTACIFDLDGTLIDSSSSILEGLRGAFAACAARPARELSAELIGPPLRETLALVAGSRDAALLDRLSTAFKAHYDSAGYRLTRVFPGVAAMLEALAAAGRPLFIATNKRLLPTQLILAHLGWSAWFRSVRALDAVTPPYADKAAMLGALLRDQGIDGAAALYVGDREEDAAAAAANALPFAWASWGYGGSAPGPAATLRLGHPEELRRHLLGA